MSWKSAADQASQAAAQATQNLASSNLPAGQKAAIQQQINQDAYKPTAGGFAKSAGLGMFDSFLRGISGGMIHLAGFASGGIASGPMSGYPVMLHGRERITPLNGRSSVQPALVEQHTHIHIDGKEVAHVVGKRMMREVRYA
jgi:hypothetical protein